MLNLNNNEMLKDHDLLISINEKIDVLLDKVKDHEKRLRWIERIGVIGLSGYLIVKEIVLRFIT